MNDCTRQVSSEGIWTTWVGLHFHLQYNCLPLHLWAISLAEAARVPSVLLIGPEALHPARQVTAFLLLSNGEPFMMLSPVVPNTSLTGGMPTWRRLPVAAVFNTFCMHLLQLCPDSSPSFAALEPSQNLFAGLLLWRARLGSPSPFLFRHSNNPYECIKMQQQ